MDHKRAVMERLTDLAKSRHEVEVVESCALSKDFCTTMLQAISVRKEYAAREHNHENWGFQQLLLRGPYAPSLQSSPQALGAQEGPRLELEIEQSRKEIKFLRSELQSMRGDMTREMHTVQRVWFDFVYTVANHCVICETQ